MSLDRDRAWTVEIRAGSHLVAAVQEEQGANTLWHYLVQSVSCSLKNHFSIGHWRLGGG